MNIAATASYNAVPSIFMVAPTGSMKREICGLILFFSSMHCMVTGSVAELKRIYNNKNIHVEKIHYIIFINILTSVAKKTTLIQFRMR